MYEIIEQNIEKDLSFDDVYKLFNSYYEEKPKSYDRTEEVDKVSVRIAKLISSISFVFSSI